MKIKNNNGFVGTDMAVAIITIFIFSGLVVSLMYNNFLENAKVKRQALANIYLTQALENVGIATYANVIQTNSNDFVPQELENDNYTININIEELFNDDLEKENIIKKVTATISYKIGNKNYAYSMERIKAKE